MKASIFLGGFRALVALLFGAAAIVFSGYSWSLNKERPLVSLDVYLKKSGTLIFTGHLKRVVYIPRDLDEKIFSKAEKISEAELILLTGNESIDVGQQFIEVESVRLIAAPEKESRVDMKKSCHFERLYIATNANFKGGTGGGAYRQNLMDKDIVMFLNHRSKYGRHEIDFPSPYFLESSGRSLHDINVYPIEILGEVYDAINNGRYVDYFNTICKIK